MYSAASHLNALHHHAMMYPRELRVMRGIDFCSNDYLSLKNNARVRVRMREFFDDDSNALCATGSRLVSGHCESVEHLEYTFRNFVQRPRALFFASGYQANLAVIASIFSGCAIFSDEFNHASIIDGILLRRGEKFVYRHHDLNHLETLLKQPCLSPKAIITESVFSTNGAVADIAAINFLAQKYDALLMVDESHATGILGDNGAGLVNTFSSCKEHIISTHSCGKALASSGAFVVASDRVMSIIKNQSRQFICTTAPPPYLIVHVNTVLEIVERDPAHRQKLMTTLATLRGILRTKVPIVALSIGDDERALHFKNHLAERGLDVAVFRYPSVRKQHAQLRITFHSGNTAAEIAHLESSLEAFV